MNWYKLINNIKEFPDNFKQGIINLIKYFPVIWKTREWDSGFTYELLIFKLKQQAKCLRKYNRYVGVQRDCQIIDAVVKLLERDKDEYYLMEYFDYYHSEMEFIPLEDNEDLSKIHFKETYNNLQEYFKKYPKLYEKYKFKEDDFSIALRMGRELQEKCHNLAFELIKRNIQKWWD